jgi:hypothetical protein
VNDETKILSGQLVSCLRSDSKLPNKEMLATILQCFVIFVLTVNVTFYQLNKYEVSQIQTQRCEYKTQTKSYQRRMMSRPGWSSSSVLATGPKVSGFKPGRGRWIFKGDKNP